MAEQRLCSIPDCGKPIRSRGYCRTHYDRLMRNGDPLMLHKVRGRRCSVPGCNKKHDSLGYCGAHALRFRRHGDPLAGGTAHHEPAAYLTETVLPFRGEECLIWPYGRTDAGYGQIHIGDTTRIVSRLVCEEINGPPDTPEHEAAHLCGNGHLGCVSPSHVRWATKMENEADKKVHGTYQLGERNPVAKLTANQVSEIIALRGALPQRVIAERYGISQSSVCLIQTGKNWSWLPLKKARESN